MAAGLPVIANPVGVHAEMIRHGETVSCQQPAEWAEAIAVLILDPALRRRLGRAGRERWQGLQRWRRAALPGTGCWKSSSDGPP